MGGDESWNFTKTREGEPEMEGRNRERRREGERGRKRGHLCRSALHYYLLEPEGEPAIVPERGGEERRFSLFMHSICPKTRLRLNFA